jgi:hypothetical protein
MGYRTVVILYNDQTDEWSKDETLGQKIMIGMNDAMGYKRPQHLSAAYLGFGRVVQCAHADTQTVAILDGYDMEPLVHSFWRQGESNEGKHLRLLHEMARQLGYKLVKDKK